MNIFLKRTSCPMNHTFHSPSTKNEPSIKGFITRRPSPCLNQLATVFSAHRTHRLGQSQWQELIHSPLRHHRPRRQSLLPQGSQGKNEHYSHQLKDDEATVSKAEEENHMHVYN